MWKSVVVLGGGIFAAAIFNAAGHACQAHMPTIAFLSPIVAVSVALYLSKYRWD